MACKPVCRLCDKFILSESVSFTGGNLIINLPEGSYKNGCKYCIVVADALPNTTTINAPVVITIGSGPVQYPLVNRCCKPILAKAIRTRYKYSVVVETTTDTGVFKLLGDLPCYSDNLRALNGDGTPVTPTPGA
ncbi:MAG: hypothetical protein HFH72_08590 [Lachnospiraceae bacterium]|nr:hypothetical protein [Lachnospiraceae bacterium]